MLLPGWKLLEIAVILGFFICLTSRSSFGGCILTHLDLSRITWKDCSVWRKYFISVSFWSNSKVQIEPKA